MRLSIGTTWGMIATQLIDIDTDVLIILEHVCSNYSTARRVFERRATKIKVEKKLELRCLKRGVLGEYLFELFAFWTAG